MKILLINPPLICDVSNGAGISYGEPLGLAYIAASVEQSGRHTVEVLDAMGLATEFTYYDNLVRYGLSHEDVIARMKTMTFDAIGITVTKMYEDNNQIVRLCQFIKEAFPDKPFIAGGPDVTLDWPIYMKLNTVDYIVVGEGETTIVKLLDHLEGRTPISDVRGLAYCDESKSVKFIPQGPPVDIENIPWPARHHFPMTNYFRLKPQGLRKKSAALLTSRACPYSCAFCSTIEVWGRKWRGRTAKDVVDEIEHLVRTYQVKEIVVFDDNFLVDRDRAEAIADGIIERKLKIGLHIAPGLMIHLLSNKLLQKFRKAGLQVVTMQLESGNPETLAYIDKHIDISKAKAMVKAAHLAGLSIYTNVLLGFFFEDRKALETSIRVAESIGFDGINYQRAEPKPGTRMYRDWVKAGIFEDGNPAVMPVDTLHFKGPELDEIVEEARRNHAEWQAKRFYRPEIWYGYLIPKYLFYPSNIFKKLDDILYALRSRFFSAPQHDYAMKAMAQPESTSR